MAKLLTSVFTDDMNHCIFTGSPYVERHHIFGNKGNRKISEKYGYVVPLRPDLHPNGVNADKRYAHDIDIYLKQMAQKHFEENHGTRDDFRKVFGKSYL